MNIFELLTVIGIIAAGYFSGKYCGHHFGLIGWIGGFVLGILIAVVAYGVFRRLIGAAGKK